MKELHSARKGVWGIFVCALGGNQAANTMLVHVQYLSTQLFNMHQPSGMNFFFIRRVKNSRHFHNFHFTFQFSTVVLRHPSLVIATMTFTNVYFHQTEGGIPVKCIQYCR